LFTAVARNGFVVPFVLVNQLLHARVVGSLIFWPVLPTSTGSVAVHLTVLQTSEPGDGVLGVGTLFVWLVAGGWWLVLICSERKVLLASCWWLVRSKRKILLAGG
jgi:hypothetical protein